MRLLRSIALVLTACCVACKPAKQAESVSPAPVAGLGNIMYVGDSITHGYGSSSYRWPLFKIWVDNGIEHREVGVLQGNAHETIALDAPYAGARFRNLHAAMSGERAYEIAGRINHSGRLENSGIHDWLGLNPDYRGRFRTDPVTERPDTFILLIGTNDLLSDHWGRGVQHYIAGVQQNLLGSRRGEGWDGRGDMDTIIAAMREANPQARIAVCTIPTWAGGMFPVGEAESLAAMARYNEELKAWAAFHELDVVEVNRGIVDVTREGDAPYAGVQDMFARDRLHPGPQGDLIIAGNIAQQLGYAGRTAGLPRRAGVEFPQHESQLVLESESSHHLPGKAGQGATVEVMCGYGNGAVEGWSTGRPLQLTLSTGSVSGTLCLSEATVSWNGRVLYSTDMSKPFEAIRLAYVPATPGADIPGGFYVWLGDMLIGEALEGTPSSADAGLTFCNGEFPVPKLWVHYDPTAAWAPDTMRFTAGKR